MILFEKNTPINDLEDFLRSQNQLKTGEKIISLERPGEGNMNVVFRVTTNLRSFVLKQSRPYVQKYQQIEAPLDRIDVEYKFYKALEEDTLAPFVPKILDYYASEHALLMEDLGNCEDMTLIYKTREISEAHLKKLIATLGLIHRTKVPHDFPNNMEMRRLNHQHIFVLPFMKENGFELDAIQPGLQGLANVCKTDGILKSIITKVGNQYLSKGTTLVHGDYYPGSWMAKSDNIYVIDPEFGFVGFPEFDLGVMIAHLIMATMNESFLDLILASYKGQIDKKLTMKVSGIEIMRRLIGLAQLPLERSLEEKEILLRTAHKLILQ